MLKNCLRRQIQHFVLNLPSRGRILSKPRDNGRDKGIDGATKSYSSESKRTKDHKGIRKFRQSCRTRQWFLTRIAERKSDKFPGEVTAEWSIDSTASYLEFLAVQHPR